VFSLRAPIQPAKLTINTKHKTISGWPLQNTTINFGSVIDISFEPCYGSGFISSRIRMIFIPGPLLVFLYKRAGGVKKSKIFLNELKIINFASFLASAATVQVQFIITAKQIKPYIITGKCM
jgi:hypothetical protein